MTAASAPERHFLTDTGSLPGDASAGEVQRLADLIEALTLENRLLTLRLEAAEARLRRYEVEGRSP